MTRPLRLLLFVVAVFFTAQPAMACCLDGHARSQAEKAVLEPPCHGTPEVPGDEDPGDHEDCAACAAVVQAPDHAFKTKADTRNVKPAFFPAEGPQVARLAAPKVRNTTGPPPASSLPPSTPITLFQRLLI